MLDFLLRDAVAEDPFLLFALTSGFIGIVFGIPVAWYFELTPILSWAILGVGGLCFAALFVAMVVLSTLAAQRSKREK